MSNRIAKKPVNGVVPAWWRALSEAYMASQSHAFIVHFNVRDYVTWNETGCIPLTTFLFSRMVNKKVVVRYNISEGITFALPAMRQDFDAYTNDATAPTADPSNPNALAALVGNLAGTGTNPAQKPEPPLPKAPAAALPLLETLLRKGVDANGDQLVGQVAVIIEYAEMVCPKTDLAFMSPDDRRVLVTLERWGTDPVIANTGNLVILVTENVADLHPAIRRATSKYEQVEIPLPTADERETFVAGQVKLRALQLEEGLTVKGIANETAMLGRIHIEDIALRAGQTGGVMTRALVRERKHSLMASEFGKVADSMDLTFGFEAIGGHDRIKARLGQIAQAIREGRKDLVPMGILFAGPAGTGKTMLAKAFARESGINALALNPAQLFGGIVGETERNWERFKAAVIAMAPTLIFIDEIDQLGVSRTGGGDSGVGNRLLKGLLEFTADESHRGDILFIGATNRPDNLDAAFRRDGRFDLKIPFLAPEDPERRSILQVRARERGLDLGSAGIADEIIAATAGWTGSELNNLIGKACQLAYFDGLAPAAALTSAVKRFRPSTREIEFMTAIALRECNDPDLLPERYRREWENREAVEEKIEQLQPRGNGKSVRSL